VPILSMHNLVGHWYSRAGFQTLGGFHEASLACAGRTWLLWTVLWCDDWKACRDVTELSGILRGSEAFFLSTYSN
jgi:hypothetical protein